MRQSRKRTVGRAAQEAQNGASKVGSGQARQGLASHDGEHGVYLQWEVTNGSEARKYMITYVCLKENWRGEDGHGGPGEQLQ